jgi:Uncharacterized conserved domain (SAYSvFN)
MQQDRYVTSESRGVTIREVRRGIVSQIYNMLCCAAKAPKNYISSCRLARLWTNIGASHPKLTRACKIVLWLLLWIGFIVIEFGSVFFLVSLFYFVYASMRTRPRLDSEPSAYSVFNPNCERITGTFTAEQFDESLRRGRIFWAWFALFASFSAMRFLDVSYWQIYRCKLSPSLICIDRNYHALL